MQEKEKERVKEKNTWRDKRKERKIRKKTKEKASFHYMVHFVPIFDLDLCQEVNV